MAPLPPASILISRKRKAELEDGQVEILQIQDSVSTHGSSGRFIYVQKKRLRTNHSSGLNLPDPEPAPPQTEHQFLQDIIIQPQPPHQLQPTTQVAYNPAANLHGISQATAQGARAHETASKLTGTESQLVGAQLQRYHLRRAPEPKSTKGFFTKITKTKAAPKVLFETRKPSTALRHVAHQPREAPWTMPTNSVPAPLLSPELPPAPLRNVRQASGHTMDWDASSAELEAAAQKYVLDSIEISLAESAKTTPIKKSYPSPSVTRSKGSPSRFKPKAPALRYHERHPSDEAARPVRPVADDEQMEDAEDEGDDAYVIEEFIRMPVEQLAMYESSKNVGLLVLEEQADLDIFYAEDSDDESEIYDEEEDENAENHPRTDYPDDEVSSDDEFGRNPYLYRNRNASDEEEFDENDATFSEDDDVVGTQKSWNRKPPWMRTEKEKEEAEAEEWN